MKLHRGSKCPFCGKTKKHQPRVKRTNPGGQLATVVACNIRGGGSYVWIASGPNRDGKPSNAVNIRALVGDGTLLPVEVG